MNFTVLRAPIDDKEKLRVRINEEDRKNNNLKWYDYVKVTVRGKSIICKLHGNDIPRIFHKGEKSFLYLNEPLRDRLKIKVNENLNFEIKKRPKGFFINWYYFIRYHPDDTVVVATWLGIIAVVLGIIALK